MSLQGHLDSHLGTLKISADDTGIRSIEFPGDRAKKTQDVSGKANEKAKAHLDTCQRELREYFDGSRKEFNFPMNPQGTPFQQKVWNELLKIPYGTVVSYADIAQKIGHPTAYRAVGLANGQNPIPICIPCHRVVASNGKLTGYAGKNGQIWRKQLLLNLEAGKREEALGLRDDKTITSDTMAILKIQSAQKKKEKKRKTKNKIDITVSSRYFRK